MRALGQGVGKQERLVTLKRPDRPSVDAQLAKVLAHAESELRRGRANEIVAQILPQVPFWSSIVPLSPWRTPWTYELLGVALKFGNEVCHLRRPRDQLTAFVHCLAPDHLHCRSRHVPIVVRSDFRVARDAPA